MRIYDFETFEKNCKNIKAIKFKKIEEVPEYERYNNKDFFGKKFKATYISDIFDVITIKIYAGVFLHLYTTTFINFNNIVEYVEINNSIDLEIE
jgi:hypothetical protein